MLTLDLRFKELLLEESEKLAEDIASMAMRSNNGDTFAHGQACGRHYALTRILPELCDQVQKRMTER
jgi:hypothetical protein